MKKSVDYVSGLIVILSFGWVVFAHLVPASWWLEVRSVSVADAVVGESPVMTVDRSIHHNFPGTYIVDVEKRQDNGRYTVVCSVRHTTNYRSDATLPQPLTLDWWVWPSECHLGVGKYRADTRWIIEDNLFPDKFISKMSNYFYVRP